MQEGMGRNSCRVREKIQGIVEGTMESSPVASHLGSLTYNSNKTCFHRGLSASFKVISNTVTMSVEAMTCSRTLLSKPC